MSEPITYKSSGVDIEEANNAVQRMREAVRKTYTNSVLSDVGSFGGLFKADFSSFTEPVLVSSIDGVGTKTKIAQMVGKFDTIGHDLVNHCVNDILAQGAKPLFFLDYYGTGNLDSVTASQVVSGVAEACTAVGCVLIGGETAQMPDLYDGADFDLVGTIVGIVDRPKVLPSIALMPTDVVIGIASSGLHTNGYTLARKALFERARLAPDSYVPDLQMTVAEALLKPHLCYASVVLPLLDKFPITAIAHITGGGFYDNLPRVIPSDTRITIDRRSWEVPALFKLIQFHSQATDFEMFRTFNMGIGLALFCRREAVEPILARLNSEVKQAVVIGEVSRGSRDVQII